MDADRQAFPLPYVAPRSYRRFVATLDRWELEETLVRESELRAGWQLAAEAHAEEAQALRERVDELEAAFSENTLGGRIRGAIKAIKADHGRYA